MKHWIDTTYRRASVDMHIPDWDARLLANFDAEHFADNLKKSGAQSHMQMCNSHAGQAMWQSRAAQVHKNMGTRDFVRELADACHARDMKFIAYYSIGHDCLQYELHPEWRVQMAFVNYWPGQWRVGLCCFNAPGYRDYVTRCIDELAGGAYLIDGMFFDMPFWGLVCYCPHCIARYRAEYGCEPPYVVDWTDDAWRQFQAARERWLLDFVAMCHNRVKGHNPDYSISFNHGTLLNAWFQAALLDLADFCDYESGDLYGGIDMHAMACKIFRDLSKSPAFELATSRTSNFMEHVTIKSYEQMRQEAFVASLHHGALLLIDYVNADGTLNDAVYDFLARINAERTPYEAYFGGDMVADVALYFDKQSLYNPDISGDLRTWSKETVLNGESPHRDALAGFNRLLQKEHIPFGLITNKTLEKVFQYKVLILPDVLELTEAQAHIVREFVRRGGRLYASGFTGLDRKNGRYILEDVFGVHYQGEIGNPQINYVYPVEAGLREALYPQDMLMTNHRSLIRTEAADTAEVWAKVLLPFVDPAKTYSPIGQPFAAFHSNPPALAPTEDPAIVRHRFGAGEVIWSSAPLERGENYANRCVLRFLLDRLLPEQSWELDTIDPVEMTVFHQPEKHRYILSLLNYTPQPCSPAAGHITLRLSETVRSVHLVPAQTPVAFAQNDRLVTFDFTGLECFMMFVVQYEESENDHD